MTLPPGLSRKQQFALLGVIVLVGVLWWIGSPR